MRNLAIGMLQAFMIFNYILHTLVFAIWTHGVMADYVLPGMVGEINAPLSGAVGIFWILVPAVVGVLFWRGVILSPDFRG